MEGGLITPPALIGTGPLMGVTSPAADQGQAPPGEAEGHRWALRGSRTLREPGDDDRPRPLPEAGGGAAPGGLR